MHASPNGLTTVPNTPDTADALSGGGRSTPESVGVNATTENTLISWRIHRLRQNPRLLPLVALAYGIGLFFWLNLFPHPLTLLLPLGALTSAMAEYLFPISYRLTDRGAYSNCFLSRLYLAWPDVKRARYGDDGVFLSPLLHPSRLDTFRGLCLSFAD
ncbi:MAG: hypothetical protein V4671_31640, partial [Armatimonadota bacterium]